MTKLHFIQRNEKKTVLTASIDLISQFNLYDKYKEKVSEKTYQEYLKDVIGIVDYTPDNSLLKLLEQEEVASPIKQLTSDQLKTFHFKSTEELDFKFLEEEPRKEKFIIKLDMKSMKRKRE